MKPRALAALFLLLVLVGSFYVAPRQLPHEELAVLRAFLTEWDSLGGDGLSDLLGNVVLISSPWQGNVHSIDVGDRKLLGLSRVGLVEDQALLCVDGGGLGMLYLFERAGEQWSTAAMLQAWIA